MNKILLSGPSKTIGYNEEIKKVIKNNLSDKLNLVCISASPNKYEKTIHKYLKKIILLE